MHHYHAPLGDGRYATRSSKTRTYTHVVIGHSPKSQRFVAIGWCGRPDLAEKLVSAKVREGYYPSVKALEAREGKPPKA